MSQNVTSMREDQKITRKAMEEIKRECENLKIDNQTLKNQVNSLSLQLQKTAWEDFTGSNKQTLLVGDSIIRDIDEGTSEYPCDRNCRGECH